MGMEDAMRIVNPYPHMQRPYIEFGIDGPLVHISRKPFGCRRRVVHIGNGHGIFYAYKLKVSVCIGRIHEHFGFCQLKLLIQQRSFQIMVAHL